MNIDDKTWQNIGYAGTILGILGVSVAGIWFAIWKSVKKAVNNKFDKEVTLTIKNAISDSMPTLIEKIIKDAQNSIFVMSQVLSLHAMKQYDEVLSAISWDGNIEKLRNLNNKVRHCIIESLYNTKTDRQANRELAWACLEDMFNEGHKDSETLQLILDIGISSKRYKETHEKVYSLLENETSSSVLVLGSTLYRKLGNPVKAEEIARKAHTIKKSQDTTLALAVLLRDQGKFDQAHDILKAECNQIKTLLTTQRTLPRGWQRILNTYIANCIDMDEILQCAPEAETLVKNITSPVETATIGRYLINLKRHYNEQTKTSYDRIFDNFSDAVTQSYECEAKIRCIAIHEQLSGSISKAETKLVDYLSNPTNKIREVEKAYLQCYVAAIQIENQEIDKAAATLIEIQDHSIVAGEAEYLLSKCYSLKGLEAESLSWLKKATLRQGRWLSKARKNPILQKSKTITDFLSRTASSQAGI